MLDAFCESLSTPWWRRLAPWLALLLAAPAAATTYELDENAPAVLGEITHYTTHYEDTFTDIARRYSLGWEEIIRVNPGIDPWLPGEGTELILPTQRILPSGPREGIVINLPEHRLYYFPKRKKGQKPIVMTYAVSIGKMDWRTPLGETRIVNKQKNPNWYPPESVRKEHAARGEFLPAVVRPGPDNPLGAFAMRLGIPPGTYLIHGTNNPLAVGMAVTHGCMRMYPEDIAELYPLVPVGTKVRIVNEPVKIAFVDGQLFVEVHPPVDAQGQTLAPDLELFSKLLDQALGPTPTAIHWELARETLQAATGLPTLVGLEADLSPTAPESAETQMASADAPAQSTDDASAGSAAEATVPSPSEPPAVAAATPVKPPTVILPEPTVAPEPSTSAPLPATPPQMTPSRAIPSLPPMPPPDTSRAAPAESEARTFPAGDPAMSTAHAVEPDLSAEPQDSSNIGGPPGQP